MKSSEQQNLLFEDDREDLLITVRIFADGERSSKVKKVGEWLGREMEINGFRARCVSMTTPYWANQKELISVECPECWHEFEVENE